MSPRLREIWNAKSGFWWWAQLITAASCYVTLTLIQWLLR